MSTPFPLLQLGIRGLKRDVAREQLTPQDAWVLRNVRSFQGKLETSPGQRLLPDVEVTGRPLLIHTWQTAAEMISCNIATEEAVYALTATGITDLTPEGGFTGTVGNLWDAIAFKDLLILTNYADPIQKWDGLEATTSDLGGTPPKARCISTLLNYVLLGGTDEVDGARIVRWCDNGFPESWEEGDPSDAGFLYLYQTPGRILRQLPLSEVTVAYKDDSICILFYVGPPFIIGQRMVINTHGLIAARAVASLGKAHVYWGTDDFYLFNGTEEQAIGTSIIRQAQASLDPSTKQNIHTRVDFYDHEVWFYHPTLGSGGVCNHAWVWNYDTTAWREEDIEATASGTWQRTQSRAWNQTQGTWSTIPGTWRQSIFSSATPLLLVGRDNGKLYQIDATTVDCDFGQSGGIGDNVIGDPMQGGASVARERVFETGILSPGADLFQRPEVQCTLDTLDVELERRGSYALEIWVGTANQLTGDAYLTWTQYTIPCDGSVRSISIRKTARYFAFRFRTAGSEESFRLSGAIGYFDLRGDRQDVP